MVRKKVDVTVTKTVVKHHHSVPVKHHSTHIKSRPRRKHTKRNPIRTVPIARGSLEEQTISTLIELQKVHVNLAEKFQKLSTQIENLLGLFELAARSFAKQPTMQNTEKDKEFLDKIDKLLDQNKLLAKGLTMMEEKMRERVYGVNQNPAMPMVRPRPQVPSPQNPTQGLEEI
jgi:hypothetical protein